VTRGYLRAVRDSSVGVYVHVPFCERVCPYCDFAVVGARTLAAADEDAYVGALLRELAGRARDFAGRRLETLYFGGGTPSLLRPASLERIVVAVRAAFPDAAAAIETTLEVNPSTVERARLPGFRAAGVNRLSLGLQSFDDTVLRRLGRAHRAAEGQATFAAARGAGFDNVSIDLIFAAPGQSLADLRRDLAGAAALGPEHVSAYALTVEEGTPFALAQRRGQLPLADEETSVAMMEEIEARLGEAGLARYEISSFARPGFASRHNRRYWRRTPVLGLGMGAWSIDPPDRDAPFGARRANVRALPAYLARVAAEGHGAADAPERLDGATARGEAAFLALRTSEGLAAAPFSAEFGAPPRAFFAAAIDELVAAGCLTEAEGGDLRLTPRGRLVSDSVFERFV
jgi:oxygen-independent coproporphyrinogen-3 oxidase